MENEPILKKTLLTVAIMAGAWVVFVGTLSLLAVAITSHAVAPSDGRDAPTLEKPSLGTVPVTPGAPSKSRSAERGHGQPI